MTVLRNRLPLLIDGALVVDAPDQVFVLIEVVPFLVLQQISDLQGFLQKCCELFGAIALVMVDNGIAVTVIQVVEQIFRHAF